MPACGTRPADTLSGAIGGTVAEVLVVGDAKRARTALEDVAEGSQAGRAI